MANLGIGAPPPTPSGKPEFTDGTNWYYLATEGYVINALSQMGTAPCLLSSTVNLNATYDNGTDGVGASLVSPSPQLLTLDGVSPATGSRVLIKDQTTLSENGIYSVVDRGSTTDPWLLIRTPDFDSTSQIFAGQIIQVVSGTSNAVTAWMQTTTDAISMGLTDIIFVNLAQAQIENILPTTNQTTVSILNNVATIGLASNAVLPGNGGITLPGGSTSLRPSTLVAGTIRYNNGQ